MQPEMVSAAIATLRSQSYELSNALDALLDSEISDVFAEIAARVLR
jgi:hypothetical protein